MSASCAPNVARITSKDIYVEYLPCATEPTTHIQHLYFDSAVDGGTFKLWVNGEYTTAIAMTGTATTDVGVINAALDALPNLAAGEIVASGTDIADITLTASGDGYYRITLVDGYDTTLTQTTPNSNPKVQTEVTTQGSDWVQVSSDLSAVDWEVTAGTVDVTSISEVARTEIAVDSSMSGSLSNYKTRTGESMFSLIFFEGASGIIRIFPEGKIAGKEIISCRILIESYSEDYPDHEKVENDVSFMRQGDWIDRPGTVYRTS